MKRIIKVLLACMMILSIAGCSKSSTKEEYVGKWTIDGEKTQEALVGDHDIFQIFGSGLRQYGATLVFKEDDSITISVGASYYGEGTYEVKDDDIVANIAVDTDEGKEDNTVTFEVETENKIKYLVSEIYDTKIYWQKDTDE